MRSTEPDRTVYSIVRGRPRLAPRFRARRGSRRLGALADVTAVPVSTSSRRIQYWTFSDLSRSDDLPSAALPVTYDLTFLSSRPVGWERAKTHGHVHSGAEGEGFAELYEVLEGHVGFLVQDLLPGPAASFAVLVEAHAGESVVIPPRLHHAAVNLGSTMLVLGDMVARRSQDDYASIRAARGMSFYVALDGSVHPNPAYAGAPSLTRVRAPDWSDAPRGPLLTRLRADPSAFDWLSETGLFARLFPTLAASYGCE